MMLLPDLLSDEQLLVLCRITDGIRKIQLATEKLNLLAHDSGVHLRPIPLHNFGMMGNDISVALCLHERAVIAARDAAIARIAK